VVSRGGWKNNLLKNLLEELEGHRWSREEDGWIWRAEEEGVFMVNSTYRKLERLLVLEGDRSEMEEHDFARRCILPMDASTECVLCNRFEESLLHLFLHCDVVNMV